MNSARPSSMYSAIPSDWKIVPLRKLLRRVKRPVEVEANMLYREIGILSHGKGIFHKKGRTGASLGNKSVYWVEPDCFVLNIVFAWEQAISRTTDNEKGMIASHRFPMYRPKRGVLDLDFLVFFFNTSQGKYLLGLASPGGAGRNKTLGQQAFLDLSIPVPSFREQRKIADILIIADRAIALTERRIEAARQRKKALMQRLSTGRVRFPEFQGEEWQTVRSHEVFQRVTRKNESGNQNVLTMSAQLGLVSQSAYFNKRVASETLSHYYLLKQGEFAYNKSYSSGYPFGAVKRLDYYEEGVLSTLYICFRLKDSTRYDSDFFVHFFEAGQLNKGIYAIAQEGARNHGLLNISIGDFFSLRMTVPSYQEQKRIASVLNTCDHEIELLIQKRDALQRQKKGLMQQLLTRRVRVCPSGSPASG